MTPLRVQVPKMLLRCICLILLINKCKAIPQDYQSKKNNEYSNEDDYPNYKQYGNPEKPNSSDIITTTTSIESDEEYDNDDVFDLLYLSPKRVLNNEDKIESMKNITIYDNTTEYLRINTKMHKPFVDVLLQYEYSYDEYSPRTIPLRVESDKSESQTISQNKVQLSGNKKLNMTYIEENNDYETDDIKLHEAAGPKQYDNKSLKYLAEFFNLDPASGSWTYKEHLMHVENDKVWYVPEKYPCWELPIVYGAFGPNRNESEVFAVYLGRLKNVIDTNPKKLPVPKNFLFADPAKVANKWCGVSPCFGDHTLCLFARKVYSTLCHQEYKVFVPTMTERIALVNTLNSMRNSVAKGAANEYDHLPTAADMKQIIYDFDLQDMTEAWLRQCLPGVAPCSSIDNEYIMQLECTKFVDFCCLHTQSNCVPEMECFLVPAVGCIHAWFLSAGKNLTRNDVECGHPSPNTFNTVQLLWAETYKVGCAFGSRPKGDIRVVCNFSPGAPFYIETNYFCGLIAHRDITPHYGFSDIDITDIEFLKSQGIHINKVDDLQVDLPEDAENPFRDRKLLRTSDLDSLNLIYKNGWVREKLQDYSNGTRGLIARLVSKSSFLEHDESRCDTDKPIYMIGPPGSKCVEKGVRFDALCYDFGDPSPGYRLVAIVAPIALFSLILFDLFSGVVRQTIT